MGAHQVSQFDDTLAVQTRQHLVLVDEHRRALVTEACARRETHADQAVGTDLPARHAQSPAQLGSQPAAAAHAVGDVVAPQQVIAADRAQVEKAVETGHAFDDGRSQADAGSHPRQHFARQPVRAGLHLAQDLHQRVAALPPAAERGVYGLGFFG